MRRAVIGALFLVVGGGSSAEEKPALIEMNVDSEEGGHRCQPDSDCKPSPTMKSRPDTPYRGECSFDLGDLDWSGPCWSVGSARGVTIGWLAEHQFPGGINNFEIVTVDGFRGRLIMHLSSGDDSDLGPMQQIDGEAQCWKNPTGSIRLCATAERPIEDIFGSEAAANCVENGTD
jgi:hypothetical protein